MLFIFRSIPNHTYNSNIGVHIIALLDLARLPYHSISNGYCFKLWVHGLNYDQWEESRFTYSKLDISHNQFGLYLTYMALLEWPWGDWSYDDHRYLMVYEVSKRDLASNHWLDTTLPLTMCGIGSWGSLGEVFTVLVLEARY